MTIPPPLAATANGLRTFTADTLDGMLAVASKGLVLLGAAVLASALILMFNPELRSAGEQQLAGWLTHRRISATGIKPDPLAAGRAPVLNPRSLSSEQVRLARWISKKYHVAPEPIGLLVQEAYKAGEINNLDPNLILAVMAIESAFNPYAQSQVGAQGLMQVMTKVHADKYEDFGGTAAAFDPKSNLRVGVRLLREYIGRGGSVSAGLKRYVGATNHGNDGGYVRRVLAEYANLYHAAHGRELPQSQQLRAEYVAAARPDQAPAANSKVSMQVATAR